MEGARGQDADGDFRRGASIEYQARVEMGDDDHDNADYSGHY